MNKILASFFLLFSFLMVSANNDINIIPEPVKMSSGTGRYILPDHFKIELNSNSQEIKFIASELGNKIATATGYKYTIAENAKSTNNIRLFLNKIPNKEIGDEGYTITVDHKGALITANKSAGLFYGTKTLLQLLPGEIESNSLAIRESWPIPSVNITDYPRFEWRGMSFDVSRHFFTKEEVMDYIDNMVKYKYNKFHFHLTDDQGWRIEIKSLPKLTEVGAWRAPRVGNWTTYTKPAPDEPKTYGGFYTHDDIREIVKYAQDRYVTVLPEIDVPGHSLAAVASYPELSCTPGTYQVNSGDKFMEWGNGTFKALVDNTLCPANEKVYEFLDKVFTEVAELFPFEYIHIGGDEAYKGYWGKSEKVQKLMKRENLKDLDEVQSYFIKRVQKIVNSKGKKIIGWDEILDGGLAPGATVMSWRGMKGGIAAAKMNHQVIMTPNTYAYFDLYQGDPVAEPITYGVVRLNTAYKFDPLPPGVDPALILGGQANLWSERLTTMRSAEYMLWPRALAAAESIWSPVSVKNWEKFYKKVENHFKRFDASETKYSRSMYDPIFTAKKDSDNKLSIVLESELDGLDIFYSFDETEPDKFYPKYTQPLSVPKDASNLRVITYRDGKQVGKLIVMPIAELNKRAGIK
jgi:hexosaminidase